MLAASLVVLAGAQFEPCGAVFAGVNVKRVLVYLSLSIGPERALNLAFELGLKAVHMSRYRRHVGLEKVLLRAWSIKLVQSSKWVLEGSMVLV